MMATTLEQELVDFMSELEAEPAPDSLGLASLAPGNDIPAKREKLAILVSTGKAKEVVGVQLTHDQVKRLSDKEVENYHKTAGSLYRKQNHRVADRRISHAFQQRPGHGDEG